MGVRDFLAALVLIGLAGCAGPAAFRSPPEGGAELWAPAVEATAPGSLSGAGHHPIASPTAPQSLRPARECPPLDPAIRAEAGRLTPIDDSWQRALILSEIAKNRALAEALAAYEACRDVSRQ